MNAVLIILIAAVILSAGYRTVQRQRKGSACCGEQEETVRRRKVRDRDPSNYPYAAELTIGGMVCNNCASRAENALNDLDGIFAKVALEGGKAVVRSKTPIERRMLSEAIRGAGYSMIGYRETSD